MLNIQHAILDCGFTLSFIIPTLDEPHKVILFQYLQLMLPFIYPISLFLSLLQKDFGEYMAIDLRGGPRITASAYRTRAKAHQQLGHVEQSGADFDKSFELDPRYAIYRYLASNSNLESVRKMGLLGIIALVFVGIFHLSLSAPKKKDEY